MCVGIKIEEPLQNKAKQSNSEQRKEKAKDAARTRRMLESDYFEELEKLLPITEPPPLSQQTGFDKTSIIRLNIAQIKAKDVLKNGIQQSSVKEETPANLDILSCLDGFCLVLGSAGDIIYVSENVSRYQGLTQVELLGQQFSEYVHPCDHNQLKLLIPRRTGPQDQHVEIFARVKCTVTERGRMIILKQASYKPLKISGKARWVPENEIGGITGTIFLGLATPIVEREVMMENKIGVFTTKHSVDMKFIDTGQWMSSIAGYTTLKLSGLSFYDLVHSQDIGNVQKAFKNLVEHGQCETSLYRLLCHGGGYVWLQTKACMTVAKRGPNKGQSILCSHQQISEVLNKEEILSTIQMKNKTHLTPSLNKGTNSVIPDDAQGPIATINMNETKMITSLMEKKIDTAPTSVIVKTSQVQSQYDFVPVIQNSRAIRQNEDFLASKADALETDRGSTDLNTTTQSIFNICKITKEPHNASDLLEELLPTIALNEGHEHDPEENSFLEDILDDIERRSPHSGDKCVVLENKDSEKTKLSFEATSFDNIQMLNFDDNFDVDARDFFEPIEKLTFDETQVLIDPNKDTMQHSGGQSIDPYEHLQNNISVIGVAECSGGARKRSQSDISAKGLPKNIQSEGGIIIDQKQRLWQISKGNNLEPPRDKVIMAEEVGKECSEEQKSNHGVFEDGSFKKRLKLNSESTQSSISIIHPMGETDMNYDENPDFDGTFGNSIDEEKMIQMYHEYKKWSES